MANLNKVMLIGRLTRNPEVIGANVGARFGFAVSNRKLNPDTKQWEDAPVFLDMEIWNRGESKQADRVLQTLRKGQQVYIEGHLKMDQWDDKNGGGKRSAIRVVVETFQYLEPKSEGMPETNGGASGRRESYTPPPSRMPPSMPPVPINGSDDDIPF